jgi:hypothetical protein
MHEENISTDPHLRHKMNDQSECDGRQPKCLEDAEGEPGLHPIERELVKIKQIV